MDSAFEQFARHDSGLEFEPRLRAASLSTERTGAVPSVRSPAAPTGRKTVIWSPHYQVRRGPAVTWRKRNWRLETGTSRWVWSTFQILYQKTRRWRFFSRSLLGKKGTKTSGQNEKAGKWITFLDIRWFSSNTGSFSAILVVESLISAKASVCFGDKQYSQNLWNPVPLEPACFRARFERFRTSSAWTILSSNQTKRGEKCVCRKHWVQNCTKGPKDLSVLTKCFTEKSYNLLFKLNFASFSLPREVYSSFPGVHPGIWSRAPRPQNTLWRLTSGLQSESLFTSETN